MTSNTTAADFIKVTVSEQSDFGAGQAIRVEGNRPALSELHADLFDVLKIELSAVTIQYYDSEGELIDIVDEDDWQTCIDEFKHSSTDKISQGLVILILDKKNKAKKPSGKAATATTSEVAKADTAAVLTISTVWVESRIQESIVESKVEPPKLEKPKEQPKLVESKPTSYRFNYTQEELDDIRKVSPLLFSRIESIFADKYEKALIEAERNFKQYHEQQLKHKIIEFQKKFDKLNDTHVKELEKLKKEKDIALAPRPTPSLFAKAALIAEPEIKPEEKNVSRKPSMVNEASPSKEHLKKYTHYAVGCDGCGDFPLRGIRYKSIHERDYDLCEACFKKDNNLDQCYIALRESKPEKFNQMIAMARNVEIPNYHETNKQMQRMHNWSLDFKDLGSFENRLEMAMEHTYF